MQAHLKPIEKLLGKLQVAEESDKDCSALWYTPTAFHAGQKMMFVLHTKFGGLGFAGLKQNIWSTVSICGCTKTQVKVFLFRNLIESIFKICSAPLMIQIK